MVSYKTLRELAVQLHEKGKSNTKIKKALKSFNMSKTFVTDMLRRYRELRMAKDRPWSSRSKTKKDASHHQMCPREDLEEPTMSAVGYGPGQRHGGHDNEDAAQGGPQCLVLSSLLGTGPLRQCKDYKKAPMSAFCSAYRRQHNAASSIQRQEVVRCGGQVQLPKWPDLVEHHLLSAKGSQICSQEAEASLHHGLGRHRQRGQEPIRVRRPWSQDQLGVLHQQDPERWPVSVGPAGVDVHAERRTITHEPSPPVPAETAQSRIFVKRLLATIESICGLAQLLPVVSSWGRSLQEVLQQFGCLQAGPGHQVGWNLRWDHACRCQCGFGASLSCHSGQRWRYWIKLADKKSACIVKLQMKFQNDISAVLLVIVIFMCRQTFGGPCLSECYSTFFWTTQL